MPVAWLVLRDLEAAMRVAGLADNPRVMAARGKNKSDIGIGEEMNLIHRPPRGHVVLERAHHEERQANVHQVTGRPPA
jgi:hypothetical protein